MADTQHTEYSCKGKFTAFSNHYVYVLDQQADDSITIKAIGYRKARANEDFADLDCGGRDHAVLNFLAIGARKEKIWDDKLIKPMNLTIKKNADWEPHKHPKFFTRKIRRSDVFSWSIETTYKLKTPTKERIDRIRQVRSWRTKNKPAFMFYWTVNDPVNSRIDFLYPTWLSKHDYSKTFVDFDFDSKPLNERVLSRDRLNIRRIRKTVNVRYVPLTLRRLITNKNATSRYYATSVLFKCTRQLKEPLTITVGFISPSAKEWYKHRT